MIRSVAISREQGAPLREQVRGWVRGEIGAGRLGVGDRIPSINALTRRFGVARETVRLSLETLVREGVLAPEHGRGYFVRERERRFQRVAILGRLDGVYVRPIYRALSERLGERAAVMLLDIRPSAEANRGTIRALAYHHTVDCVLAIPVRGQEQALHRLLRPFRRYFRLAWLDRAPKSRKDPAFVCDYTRCVNLALEHFRSTGVEQRIYFSRQPEDQSVFSTMRRAYRDFQRDRGRAPRVIGDWRKVLGWAKRGRTGVVTDTDQDAIHLQGRLLLAGVKVPDQVSIISSDNSPELEWAAPAISSVDPGFEEIGRAVAEWILGEHAQKKGAEPLLFRPVPRLVLRGSCEGQAGSQALLASPKGPDEGGARRR